MAHQIQLLQFLICRDFKEERQDAYTAETVHGNLYAAKFPHRFGKGYVITCWRKDGKFHKEVIEYSTDYGAAWKSPHMDIEPVTNSVIFRWHKHPFPPELVIEKPTTLTVRVNLDGCTAFESYLLIEQTP